MKHYIIRRYGMMVCEFDGKEQDLLLWIRNNVPPSSGKAAIRSKDVLIGRRLLYLDADKAGITITCKDSASQAQSL